MNGLLIVLSGMDGAGKSTHIGRLHDQLVGRGRRVKILWSRGGYTPGMNLLKSMLRLAGERAIPAAGPSRERTARFRRPWVRRTWLTLALCDLILLYGVGIRVWRWIGYDVLCDRYLQDTRLDFALNFPNERVATWWLWKLLCWTAPRPDAAFLLMVSVSQSQERSLRKQEPFPDSAATLQARWKAYRSWTDEWYVLDGSRPLAAIAREMDRQLSYLDKRQTAVPTGALR